jgi:uncharacterized DUF497 family protein
MADFSWDETKRQDNIARRKVDFARAAQIFRGPVLERLDTRVEYGENRYVALGEARGRWYVVIYTWRGQTRHIITAWTVDESGRRRYQKLLLR